MGQGAEIEEVHFLSVAFFGSSFAYIPYHLNLFSDVY